MQPAPLYEDVAAGPPGGEALWIRAADGVRLRIARWPAPEAGRGTVFLFPGRTEYIEKYAPAAADLAARGFAMACIDWRGQGLADRLADDPMLGHVDDFAAYQRDVDALFATAARLALPAPWFLLAHSMGGCIGLRALLRGAPVQAALFSGPMWGIAIPPLLRAPMDALAGLMTALGRGARYAPTTGPRTYVLEAPFEGNQLTRDRAMWEMMVQQARAHPELTLGGPSLGWFRAARRECRALQRSAPPQVPAHAFLGGNERIVDPRPVHAIMGRWPGGRLTVVPGAEHEIVRERPETRVAFFDAAAALFSKPR